MAPYNFPISPNVQGVEKSATMLQRSEREGNLLNSYYKDSITLALKLEKAE